tara:strand:- start:242 stop:619 length:378 start_codon:yes stop_codon:yes gene_type:complete
MDPNIQGSMAEYAVALEFMKLGYIVSKPLLDSCRYDLLVDTGSRIVKIQVKSKKQNAWKQKGRKGIQMMLDRHKPYNLNQVDFFAVYVADHGGFYIIKNDGKMKSVKITPGGKYKINFNNFASIN